MTVSQNNSEQPNIAIVGAGIGGLALAVGLARQGIHFTLYEAAEGFGAIGAGIGLGPNALNALELILPGFGGLYDRISSGNVTPGKEHVMMDAMLVEEGFGEKQGWMPVSYGAECYTRTSAHRTDLLDILKAPIPSHQIRFNKRLRSVEQDKDGVAMTFCDNEVVRASCVIGCDGIRGITRSAVLNTWPELVPASYTGKYAYRGIIPMEKATNILGKDALGNEIAGDAKMFMGEQCVMTIFPISNGEQCNVVCFILDKEWNHHEWTRDVTREEMVAHLTRIGMDGRLVQLLNCVRPTQWAINDHLTTPTYFNKRICLVGDVAHATSPHQAAGAGQCTEDALILSHLLGLTRNHSELETAFSVYDSLRRPRAQQIVKTSREAFEIYALRYPGIEDNQDKVIANMNKRFLWIWEHDLLADLVKAETDFNAVVSRASALKTYHEPYTMERVISLLLHLFSTWSGLARFSSSA